MGKVATCLTVFTALLLPATTYASHAMGTDITYTCLGNDKYIITVAFYRDCSGISAPSSINITFFSASCGILSTSPLSHTLMLQSTATKEVTPLCARDLPRSTCNRFGPRDLPGVEQYIYADTIYLPYNCSDWIVGYSECCRNANITNLVSASSYDLYAYARINNANGICNNSPVFTTLPVPYICDHIPFNYNHGAVDPDGDSLAYQMVQPSDNYQVYIPYDGPFSVNYPLSTTNQIFQFDPVTGQMTMTPDIQQYAVVTVQVTEYRNGVIVGSTMRDIQIVVLPQINCSNAPPVIPNSISNISGGGLINANTIQMCPSTRLTFEVVVTDPSGDSVYLSSNASAAIPGSSFTVIGAGSTVTGRFSWMPSVSDTGFHPFQITYSDNGCPVSTPQTVTYVIYVFSKVEAGPDQVYCGDSIQLNAFGGSWFSWTPSAGLSRSDIANPKAKPGARTVYRVFTDCGSDSVLIDVQPSFTLSAGRDTAICLNALAKLKASVFPAAYGPYSFSWTPAIGVTNPNGDSTFARPMVPTSYYLTAISAQGCIKRDTVTVNISGVAPVVEAYADPLQVCSGERTRLELVVRPSSCTTTTTPCGTTPVIFTVGSGSRQTSSSIRGTPFKGSYEDARLQYLYKASELNALGITGGTITQIAFNVAAKRSGNMPYNNFTIKLGCTPVGFLSGYESGLSTVFGPAAYTTIAGWNTFSLTSPYDWDGISNLIVQVCFDNITTSQDDDVYYTATPYSSVAYFYDGLTAGCNMVSSMTDTTRPHLRLAICPRSLGNTITRWTVFSGSAAISNPTISNPTAQVYGTTIFKAEASTGGCAGEGQVAVTVDTTFTVRAKPDTSLCRPNAIQLNAIASGQPSPIYLTCGINGTPATTPVSYQIGTSPGITPSPTPYKGNNHDARIQMLFTRAELEAVSMRRGVFTSIAFEIAFKASTLPFRNFTIKMGCTSLESLGSSFEPNLPVVFNPKNVTTTTGWNVHNFDNHYDWDGFSNIIVEVCFDNNYYPLDDIITYTPTSFTSVLFAAMDYSPSGGCNLATPTSSSLRPNVRFAVSRPPLSAFSYSWSPASTLSNAVIQNPLANPTTTTAYVVTMTDGICLATDTARVDFYTSFDVNVYGTNVGCNGAFDGNVVSVPAGGVRPYNFFWSTGRSVSGVSSDTLYNLYAGTYHITVVDNNGCDAIGSVTLTVPPPLLINNIAVRDVSCFNGNNGSVLAAGSGGTPPYAYLWSSGNTGALATQLPAGTHSVTLTDASGCTATGTAVLTAPPPLVSSVTSTNATCYKYSDGSATAAASGGTPPYQYRWSDSQTGASVTGLPAGTYMVSITDDSFCTHTDTAIIGQPDSFSIIVSALDVSCFNGSDGRATASVMGDTINYSFLWHSTPPQSTATATGLPAGPMLLSVTDTAECTIISSLIIGSPGQIMLSASANDVSCFGQGDGSAAVRVASGGTPPFTYLWSNALSNTSISGLTAGTYYVTVTDNNGCTEDDSVAINEPLPISFDDSVINISCFGRNDGRILPVNISGGTGTPIFRWSDGQTTPMAINLAPGIYSVTATDRNGCTSSIADILVESPTQVVIENILITPSCPGGQPSGVISFGSSGGIPPYQFILDGTVIGAVAEFTGLAQGVHHIAVRDDNGCPADSNVTVMQYNTVAIAFDTSEIEINLGEAATLQPIVQPFDTDYQLAWIPATGLSCTDCLNPIASPFVTTTYQLTVIDEHGCPFTGQIKVNVTNNLILMVPSAFTPNGDGVNDVLNVYGVSVNSLKFMVFDRWGEKLFETTNPDEGWDGTFKGKMQPAGVYAYYVDAVFDDGQRKQIKGGTTILK